ncbi:hypothetical protein F4803DRAFT_549617 [Xylaria telfairii]|nr:hypothetical protein F4803DRAFT_549617 [Xylaria telfairii]
MLQRGKTRVFVAAYFREGITSSQWSEELLHHARFHWAIWTEPKGSTGTGSCYQAMKYDEFINVPDWGGWQYEYIINADYTRSGSMLGRIMVGKLPNDVSPYLMADTLSSIPLPTENNHHVENCVNWTVAALQELQRRGWVDNFDTHRFMDHALRRANSWYSNSCWRERNLKETYVLRRFP